MVLFLRGVHDDDNCKTDKTSENLVELVTKNKTPQGGLLVSNTRQIKFAAGTLAIGGWWPLTHELTTSTLPAAMPAVSVLPMWEGSSCSPAAQLAINLGVIRLTLSSYSAIIW